MPRQVFVADPWTLGGDRFLLTRASSHPVLDWAEPIEETKHGVSWHRADGTLVREDALDPDARSVLTLITSHAAGLAMTTTDEDARLWYVPVSDSSRELLHAEKIPVPSLRCSSDRRWAAIRASWDDNDPDSHTTQWYRIRMDDGAVEPVVAPHPQAEIHAVTPDNDGALFWLQGRLARPKETRDYTPGDNIPDDITSFAEPGLAFSVWYDDPSDAEAARAIYAETNTWLGFDAGGDLRRLHAIRLLGEPKPHPKYVCLEREGMSVEVEPLSREEYGESLPETLWQRDAKSFLNGPVTASNGRYRLEIERPWGRLWLTDLETNTRRYLRRSSPLVGLSAGMEFSPDSRHGLLEIMRSRQDPWRPFFLGGMTIEPTVLAIDFERAFGSALVKQ